MSRCNGRAAEGSWPSNTHTGGLSQMLKFITISPLRKKEKKMQADKKPPLNPVMFCHSPTVASSPLVYICFMVSILRKTHAPWCPNETWKASAANGPSLLFATLWNIYIYTSVQQASVYLHAGCQTLMHSLLWFPTNTHKHTKTSRILCATTAPFPYRSWCKRPFQASQVQERVGLTWAAWAHTCTSTPAERIVTP